MCLLKLLQNVPQLTGKRITTLQCRQYTHLKRAVPIDVQGPCEPRIRRVPCRFYSNRNLLTLQDRGLITAIFPDLPKKFMDLCNGSAQTVYAGFDPTADSLHVGNLAVIVALLHCLRAGHNVIALIGGATGMIGDPSGKNSERPSLEKDIVAANSVKITENVRTIFENHQKIFWDDKGGKEPLPSIRIVNNIDWYKRTNVIDFYRQVGRHCRITAMLQKDSVQSRLGASEGGMSFLEFSYQVFQAYDWLYLRDKHDCRIQVGGSDQMGNINAGHELISRTRSKDQVYGMTVPLITSEEGDKFGKTGGNAVWLSSTKTSPFNLYQFFIRVPDSDVQKLLSLLTVKSDSEITNIVKKHMDAPEKRHAQRELATSVTLLVHGESGLSMALKATEALYSENIEALASLKPDEICALFSKGNENSVATEIYLNPGTTVLDMVLKAKCFPDQRNATRIINDGGFYLNYQRVTNTEEVITPGIHILPNKISLARVGKKNYYVIKWNP